jgi:hypothetical protein
MDWLPDLEIARQIPTFWPALGLALGVPLALLILNEAIAACDRRGFLLGHTLRAVRTLLVPAAALLLFLGQVVELPADSLLVRLAETLFWVAVLATLTRIFNDLFFGFAAHGSWQERVPTLFRDLVRVALGADGARRGVGGHRPRPPGTAGEPRLGSDAPLRAALERG